MAEKKQGHVWGELDREWLKKAARGEIDNKRALRNVQIMRGQLEDGTLDPELAAALKEGDEKYPPEVDPVRYVALRAGPDPIETDPATNEAIDRLLEELPDVDPQDQPDDDDLQGLPLEDRIERSLLTTEQILDLPPPEWLIDNFLVKNSLAVLYGPSGCGKTFLALDWALHVATGSYWHGNRVDGGAVLYIAAEGVAGIGKRVKAWMEHNRIYNLDRIHWLPEAVNVAIPETVAALIKVAKRLQPSLIVVDTLARSIVGVDENSAKDMGEVVSYLDQLRRATGACVLVVHHTGKDTSAGARGSSALRAAIDTELEVVAADPQMTVKVKKQKEAAAVDPVRLTRIEAGESCVLVPSSKVAGDDALPDGALAALEALRGVAVPGGISTGVWEEAAEMPRATFYRYRSRLIEAGLVKNVGTERQPRYVPVDQEERRWSKAQVSGEVSVSPP